MTKLTTIQTTFASGELDPSLSGQEDLKAYREGARQIRNGVRRATGGVGRRPGFDDVAGMFEARLEEFEFSDTQRYVLAFGDQTLSVFDLNGVRLQQISGCPWQLEDVDELTFSLAGDVMVITNITPTKLLRRVSSVAFELTTFVFDKSPNQDRIYQPYYKFALPAVTMTPSAATGAITLTASSTDGWGGFVAGHVGQRFRIYDGEVEITAVTDSTNANATVKKKLEGTLDLDPFKTTRGSQVVEVTHAFHGLSTGATIALSGATDTGRIPGNKFDGSFAITVIDEHHYSITLTGLSYTVREDADFDGVNENSTFTTARDSDDGGGPSVKFAVGGTPTRNWLEPSIGPVRGYPAASCFHEGRLWLGGTPSQPDARFGSKALFPYNFDVGLGLDGDSVQVAGDTEDMSRVRHMVSNGDLQIFTATREAIFVQGGGQPITPSTARSKNQSNAGSGGVQPVIFDGATLFVQENRLSISELSYSDRSAAYLAVPISTLAGHLVRRPRSVAVSLGTTSKAEQFAFFVNEDGTIAVFHSLRTENIAGWGLWELGGGAKARSVCTAGQYVYLCVEMPDGLFRLWRMAEGGWAGLDGQIRHVAAAPRYQWILSQRCRERTLHVVSELGHHGEFEVPEDGFIELDQPVSALSVGEAFYLTVETLPPTIAIPEGPRSGMPMRIVRAILNLVNARGLTVNGKPLASHDPADLSGPVPPLNGRHQKTLLGFSRDPTVTISQSAPLPVDAVLTVLTEVKI